MSPVGVSRERGRPAKHISTTAPQHRMASQLVARGGTAYPRKPGSGHADTISITVYMRRTR